MPRKDTLKYVDLSNQRGFKEQYQEYRKRLRENYYKVKYYLRGEIVWNSFEKGPYKIKR